MDVIFRQRYPWAVLPYRFRAELKTAEADAAMYAKNFRWVRKWRSPEMCWPWRAAQESGWVIPSPVDVRVHPIESQEVVVNPFDRQFFVDFTGYEDLSQQPGEETAFAFERRAWLKVYEVAFRDGFDTMFIPRGADYVEWRLGWDMVVPEDHVLLILPVFGLTGIEVVQALHDPRCMPAGYDNYGLTLAIRPLASVDIKRRQPLA